jgi:hypothetical protein
MGRGLAIVLFVAGLQLLLITFPSGDLRAPSGFGELRSNVLLVGNFGDGTINAFNIYTGESLGPPVASAEPAVGI